MLKKIGFFFVVPFLISLTLHAGSAYPLQEYELLVIESLPEAMDLDMTLSEIETAKENSRLGALKRRLNASVFKRIAPLLAKSNFSEGFNLLQLPQLLPLKEIINDLNLGTGNGPNPLPADFIIVIAPKLPVDLIKPAHNSYAKFYPSNKGNLVSAITNTMSPLQSYEQRLNHRMMQGAEYLFQRQYQNGAAKQGFLAGAMIAIHAEGTNSYAKAKFVAGLPTDMALPFEQANEQIRLTQLLFPRTPYSGYITRMENPIVMATFEHHQSGPNPLQLKLAFGTLGPMDQANAWNVGSSLSDATVTRWFAWLNPHNVPHFRGEIRSLVQKEMLGWFGGATDWVNGLLASKFDIQLNLHEVTIDLMKLEISDVKMSIALPWKGSQEFLPTFRNGEPEEQFKNEGNKVLNEQKEKIQELLDSGLLILADQDAQKLLLDTINSLLADKEPGAQQ